MNKVFDKSASASLIAFFLLFFVPVPFRTQCVDWVAVHILHVPIKYGISGSGDRMFNYVQLLLNTVLALFLGIFWAILSGQKQDAWMRKWSIVLLRYYVAMQMFTYGMYKVFHLQMPSPSLFQLIQPLGDKSPMGLAWTFVGFSKGYSMFVGLAEVVSGLLLLFVRTKTLGALLTMIVMVNVVAMNMAFDIPVKIFSTILVAMALYIAWDDLGRLANVLLWNKPSSPAPQPELFASRRMKIIGMAIKTVLIAYYVFSFMPKMIHGNQNYGDKRPRPTLRGIYDNELMVVNGDTIPRIKPRDSQWKQLIIDYPEFAHVKGFDDSISRIPLKTDFKRHQLVIGDSGQGFKEARLEYQIKDDTLTVNGRIYADSVYMRFKKQDLSRYRLINTGFHWVSEYPYNR